jgi:hypothetical protein
VSVHRDGFGTPAVPSPKDGYLTRMARQPGGATHSLGGASHSKMNKSGQSNIIEMQRFIY